MDQDGTKDEAGGDATCRALAVVQARDEHDKPVRSRSAGRPMAGFLAQLIVDTDPALRVARLERTRVATTLYERAAGRPGRRCA